MLCEEHLPYLMLRAVSQVSTWRESLRAGPCPVVCPEWTAVIDALCAGEFGTAEDVGPLLHSLQWENDYYLLQADFPSCTCVCACMCVRMPE